jgi:hypothetical protein
MKIYFFLILLSAVMISCQENTSIKNSALTSLSQQIIDSTDLTNNFYDNAETFSLPLSNLLIEGEISNPGIVDFNNLTKRSIIVKETILEETGGNKFTGAFRYDGYSLMDILNNIKITKTNDKEFPQVIDLYVEIENAKGDKVLFSWGELYYPNNLHKIILATNVSRIVPSKTKDLWILPNASKIVSGNDLITERNISEPTKITVRSYPKSFKTVKGLSPLFSTGFSLYKDNKELSKISAISSDLNLNTYNTIFYGRGKGIHSTEPFKGVFLKSMIGNYYPLTRENIMTGIFCFVAKDGYRMTVSYSELFNRNDQQEFLLIKTSPDEDGGLFRIFPGCDFFSDRAIKSLTSIYFNN